MTSSNNIINNIKFSGSEGYESSDYFEPNQVAQNGKNCLIFYFFNKYFWLSLVIELLLDIYFVFIGTIIQRKNSF